MNKINYLQGDVLEPVKIAGKTNLIVHCVNNVYSFGSGVAGAIAKKWPNVREAYMNRASWSLGDIQYVKIDSVTCIVNLRGQRSVGNFYETIPVRYESIEDGLIFLREDIRNKNAFNKVIVNLPRIGCGRAKGNWDLVEKIIEKVYNSIDITINVYTLKEDLHLYERKNK